ncbi:hypothetical protein HMPREF3213_00991 [Heyndrickxia coagulans]|uniref:Uncharacterized protein n=1 Tax=Heyndrickxia coagulans TaxID=1398 RepID=A0A133KWI3_HEYCO|nr:hypothetical protein HMPREF3213_00991 [Heyndrickxia coagulans]
MAKANACIRRQISVRPAYRAHFFSNARCLLTTFPDFQLKPLSGF